MKREKIAVLDLTAKFTKDLCAENDRLRAKNALLLNVLKMITATCRELRTNHLAYGVVDAIVEAEDLIARTERDKV